MKKLFVFSLVSYMGEAATNGAQTGAQCRDGVGGERSLIDESLSGDGGRLRLRRPPRSVVGRFASGRNVQTSGWPYPTAAALTLVLVVAIWVLALVTWAQVVAVVVVVVAADAAVILLLALVSCCCCCCCYYCCCCLATVTLAPTTIWSLLRTSFDYIWLLVSRVVLAAAAAADLF